jgi:16S rRNA (cytosine1402-N4)-methyltransferase
MMKASVHVPILLKPIVDALVEPFLSLPEGAARHWILDCTLGGGGHTSVFLKTFYESEKLGAHGVIAFDQDEAAIKRARVRFEKEIASGRLILHHARFSDAPNLLKGHPVLGILADLGFSSDQIEDPHRGLSFRLEGPLDMRLDASRGEPCYELLQRISEKELKLILQEYGEERFAGRIARTIIEARQGRALPKTTEGFAELISNAVPSKFRYGRIHPATRSFQALRIAVNEELNELDAFLRDVVPLLESTGRAAVLSFHSLEDRRVKQAFRELSQYEGGFRPVTRKPISPDSQEIAENSRSRSAKLRIVEKK